MTHSFSTDLSSSVHPVSLPKTRDERTQAAVTKIIKIDMGKEQKGSGYVAPRINTTTVTSPMSKFENRTEKTQSEIEKKMKRDVVNKDKNSGKGDLNYPNIKLVSSSFILRLRYFFYPQSNRCC